MSRERPTLDELRARVFKGPVVDELGRHRDAYPGNVLARWWGRPAAVPGTWMALRLGLSAHQVTVAALVAGLASAVAFGTGTRAGFLAGVGLGYLAFWLDHVDGQVARWRGTSSLGGVYLDYLMHHAHALALGFGLGYGLSLRTGDPRWSAAGFLVGAGWLFLGLHNDCRYKAFFARVKGETRSYRIDGAGAETPAPPAPWPRRGLGMLSWPLVKACEGHVVLMTLTAIALVGLIDPGVGIWLWKGYVLLMAIAAPSLAVLRAWRAVVRGTIDTEFDGWFRPCDGL